MTAVVYDNKPELRALSPLARRLVTHPKWRWAEGMAACAEGWFDIARVCSVDHDGTPYEVEYRGYLKEDWDDHPEAEPVLTDWATIGCLMEMLIDSGARVTGWSARAPVGGSGNAKTEAQLFAKSFAEELLRLWDLHS